MFQPSSASPTPLSSALRAGRRVWLYRTPRDVFFGMVLLLGGGTIVFTRLSGLPEVPLTDATSRPLSYLTCGIIAFLAALYWSRLLFASVRIAAGTLHIWNARNHRESIPLTAIGAVGLVTPRQDAPEFEGEPAVPAAPNDLPAASAPPAEELDDEARLFFPKSTVSVGIVETESPLIGWWRPVYTGQRTIALAVATELSRRCGMTDGHNTTRRRLLITEFRRPAQDFSLPGPPPQ